MVQISGDTQFCGLFGGEIAHSPSPAFHTHLFQQCRINGIYLPFPCANEDDFLSLVQSLTRLGNFLGGNITIPYKRSILKLEGVQKSQRVTGCGASNTLYRRGEQWFLENTDILGVLRSLQALKVHRDEAVAILGGGGAALACLAAWFEYMPEAVSWPTFFVRNPHKLETVLANDVQLPHHFLARVQVRPLESLKSMRFTQPTTLINTLPFGYNNEENPWVTQIMQRCHQLKYFETLYIETPAYKAATQMGKKAITGRMMFETQAEESFKLFNHMKTL